MARFLSWTVKFSVDKLWVEDGFDLTDERAHEMIWRDLQWATGDELKAKVIEAPDSKLIRKIQGYKD